MASDLTRQKIEQSIKDRKKLHRTFVDNSKTFKPLLELEAKAFKNGALDQNSYCFTQ